MAAELSAIEIKRLKHPGGDRSTMVAAGGVSGLHLQLLPSGGKSWILRTLVAGKRREIGLGGFPDVTLAQARERAREAKDAIRRGIDPIEERKAARASLAAARRRGLLFKDAVDQYLAAKLEGFRNEKHRHGCQLGALVWCQTEAGWNRLRGIGLLEGAVDFAAMLDVLDCERCD